LHELAHLPLEGGNFSGLSPTFALVLFRALLLDFLAGLGFELARLGGDAAILGGRFGGREGGAANDPGFLDGFLRRAPGTGVDADFAAGGILAAIWTPREFVLGAALHVLPARGDVGLFVAADFGVALFQVSDLDFLLVGELGVDA
jgi:hypothetical protein